MEKLRRVLDFCIRHQTVLGCSIVSLLTAASEHIFSTVVFKCPCNSGNMLYGSVFLTVPAFVLFLLGYMVNARTWRLLTGCCPQEKRCSCSPWATCARHCHVLVPVTAKALVAPLTWIAVALLGANFYECAASGSGLIQRLVCEGKGEDCHKQLANLPCDKKGLEELLGESPSLQAQSQVKPRRSALRSAPFGPGCSTHGGAGRGCRATLPSRALQLPEARDEQQLVSKRTLTERQGVRACAAFWFCMAMVWHGSLESRFESRAGKQTERPAFPQQVVFPFSLGTVRVLLFFHSYPLTASNFSQRAAAEGKLRSPCNRELASETSTDSLESQRSNVLIISRMRSRRTVKRCVGLVKVLSC